MLHCFTSIMAVWQCYCWKNVTHPVHSSSAWMEGILKIPNSNYILSVVAHVAKLGNVLYSSNWCLPLLRCKRKFVFFSGLLFEFWTFSLVIGVTDVGVRVDGFLVQDPGNLEGFHLSCPMTHCISLYLLISASWFFNLIRNLHFSTSM